MSDDHTPTPEQISLLASTLAKERFDTLLRTDAESPWVYFISLLDLTGAKNPRGTALNFFILGFVEGFRAGQSYAIQELLGKHTPIPTKGEENGTQ